jgi:hypothetical protein
VNDVLVLDFVTWRAAGDVKTQVGEMDGEVSYGHVAPLRELYEGALALEAEIDVVPFVVVDLASLCA